MSQGPEAKDAPRTPDEERTPGDDWLSELGEPERRAVLAWVGENLSEVRRSAYGHRSLYWALGVGFAIGLAAYGGGYALREAASTEPLRFVGDLLYTLGWALWTGVVVVVFLQIVPEVKRRQYRQALDAYEAQRRDPARPDGYPDGEALGEGDAVPPPSSPAA
jgi:hypothetical protein